MDEAQNEWTSDDSLAASGAPPPSTEGAAPPSTEGAVPSRAPVASRSHGDDRATDEDPWRLWVLGGAVAVLLVLFVVAVSAGGRSESTTCVWNDARPPDSDSEPVDGVTLVVDGDTARLFEFDGGWSRCDIDLGED